MHGPHAELRGAGGKRGEEGGRVEEGEREEGERIYDNDSDM